MAKTNTRSTSNHAPRHLLALSPEQDALLTEMATLVYYSQGFAYTRDMTRLTKLIADRATPAAQRACLTQAHARELAC